ncbi:hypothetical protein ACKWTF_012631 [Chironomus riparius]
MVLEVASLTNENFLNELQESAAKKDWKNILKISKRYGFAISTIALWVFPSEFCLQQMKTTLKSLNISNILSIGCGIGLLEFIIRESVGVKMSGLEIDSKYWSRKKPFINLKFVEHGQELSSKLILDTCLSKNWDFALLFCYFNLRRAFNEYIKYYKGNYVIIIGPAANTGRYTDPLPLDFQDNEEFQLVHLSDFGDNRDLLAIYERKNKKFAV